MAVPDLIFRQKFQTMSVAMNVKTMLADFLRFVTPKTMHKARFSVLLCGNGTNQRRALHRYSNWPRYAWLFGQNQY